MSAFASQEYLPIIRIVIIIILKIINAFEESFDPPYRGEAHCKVVNREGPRPYLTCENVDLNTLPKKQPENIDRFLLTGCVIRRIDGNDAKRYPKLKEFTYFGYVAGERGSIRRDVELLDNAFISFPILEEVDIRNIFISKPLKGASFPSTIQSVRISNSNLLDNMLVFGNLPQLYEIIFNSNNLTRVPEVNSNTSLLRMNLRQNPITEIVTKKLLKLCKLSEFFISKNYDLEAFLNKNCECYRLSYFFKKKGMKVDWWPECKDLSCKDKKEIVQDITFEVEKCKNIPVIVVKDEHSDDDNRTEVVPIPARSSQLILYLLWGIIAAIIIILGAFFAYMTFTSKRNKPTDEVIVDELDLAEDIDENENEILD